jgi:hypothetical protein
MLNDGRIDGRTGWQSGWLTAWLIAALLFAQTSGVLHRVVHNHASGYSHTTAAIAVASSASTASSVTDTASAQPQIADNASHHWLSHLWGDHGQRTDCQLFDQLANVAPPLQPISVALLVTSEPIRLWFAPKPQALFERFYSAQAPPVFL